MTDNAPIDLGVLLDWCRRKTAHKISQDSPVDFNVLGEFLGSFAEFQPKVEPEQVLLRCRDTVRESLEHANPGGIKLSSSMAWGGPGWHFAEVQLNGSIPLETMKNLIDDSYQIVCDSLKPDQRHQIDLIGRNLSPAALLDELITDHGLAHRRADVLKTSCQCILLKTLPADQSPPTTRSRIGGAPSLPKDLRWPRHSSGKPLTFLAQIDLAEIAAVALLPDIPCSGLLCLFSCWGWQDPDSADPDLPDGDHAEGLTQVYYVDPSSIPTQGRKTPSKIHAFPSAAVQPILVLSLPRVPEEPVIADLGFSGDEAQRLVGVADSYNDLLGYQLGHPARHLFLGYADYVQRITDGVARQNLKLFIQIASDPNTSMGWGDGGYLYFFIKPENLNPLDLYGLVSDYQCG